MARNVLTHVIAPVMKATGFRFSKEYRWGASRWHRLVYACVSTVGANYLADGEAWPWF